MKKRLIVLCVALLLILNAAWVLSHEEGTDYKLNPSDIYPISTWQMVGYGSAVFTFFILIMFFFHKQMAEGAKKLLFYLVVATCAIVTLYIVVTTLHLNLISVTKGPVHWHADYEIWACDKQIALVHPSGMSNKQGVDLMHSHDDNRIHVEGALLDKKAASLGAFFNALGGKLTDTGFEVPSRDGIVVYEDGYTCNEQPGKLYVFVNGKPIEHPDDYVIGPYETVPPGDRIKIIFTEKPIEEIDPNIKNVMKNGG